MGTPGVFLNGNPLLLPTGNGNKNIAIGKDNTAQTVLGNRNTNIAVGAKNVASTLNGVANTEAIGPGSATASGVNNQNVSVVRQRENGTLSYERALS